MNDALRQSGRTMRLIERACKEAYVGRAVYLLVVNEQSTKLVASLVNHTWAAMGEKGAHGIKVESMFHWDGHRQWNWPEMKPMYSGAHPNSLFLVDHAAVEMRLEQVHAEIKHLAELAGKLYPHTV